MAKKANNNSSNHQETKDLTKRVEQIENLFNDLQITLRGISIEFFNLKKQHKTVKTLVATIAGAEKYREKRYELNMLTLSNLFSLLEKLHRNYYLNKAQEYEDKLCETAFQLESRILEVRRQIRELEAENPVFQKDILVGRRDGGRGEDDEDDEDDDFDKLSDKEKQALWEKEDDR